MQEQQEKNQTVSEGPTARGRQREADSRGPAQYGLLALREIETGLKGRIPSTVCAYLHAKLVRRELRQRRPEQETTKLTP